MIGLVRVRVSLRMGVCVVGDVCLCFFGVGGAASYSKPWNLRAALNVNIV